MNTDYTYRSNTRANILITRAFFLSSLALQAAILYGVFRL